VWDQIAKVLVELVSEDKIPFNTSWKYSLESGDRSILVLQLRDGKGKKKNRYEIIDIAGLRKPKY
jgi:hypothetical protein